MGFFGDIGRGINSALRGISPGSVLGGVLGGPIGAFGGQLVGGLLQNASARSAAREQMAFQERMSSTAWQRGVEDMRKAGINPIMAASQGPASSPGGSQADVPANIIGGATSTAMQAVQLQQTLSNMKTDQLARVAEMARTKAETAYTSAKTAAEFGSAFKGTSLYAQNLQAAIEAAKANAAYSRAGVPERGARGDILGVVRPFAQMAGRGNQMLTNLLPGFNPFWLQQRIFKAARERF